MSMLLPLILLGIWKIYGTPTRKGDNTEERPWRVSKILKYLIGIEDKLSVPEGVSIEVDIDPMTDDPDDELWLLDTTNS